MITKHDEFSHFLDVPVSVTVELGRRSIPLGEILQMGPGAVVELGKAAGESLDLLVNGKLVARGEAVVVGEKYGIRIVEVIGANELASPLTGMPAANQAPAPEDKTDVA